MNDYWKILHQNEGFKIVNLDCNDECDYTPNMLIPIKYETEKEAILALADLEFKFHDKFSGVNLSPTSCVVWATRLLGVSAETSE
jgi:hypothetical protein